MKPLLFAALLFLPLAVGATTVGLHLASVHDKEGFNDTNPGVYVYLDNGLSFGTVYNSRRRQSYYAGLTLGTALSSRVSVAATVGGITGYRHDVKPMLVPSVAVRVVDIYHVRLAYLGKQRSKGVQALHLMVEGQF